MKKINLKWLVAALVVATSTTHTFAAVGNEGRGGGGIKRNGKYLTFASAGATLSVESMDEAPGLELLDRAVNQLTLPDDLKSLFKRSYLNFSPRTYFQVVSDSASKSKKNITKIYESLFGEPQGRQKIVLFAVTEGSETYLFPEFFMLTEVEQAAIMWHEMLWVLSADVNFKSKKIDYAQVVDLEIRFQKYVESGFKYNRNFYLELAKTLDRYDIAFEAALKEDHLNNRTNLYMDIKGNLQYWKLFDAFAISRTRSTKDGNIEIFPDGSFRSISSCAEHIRLGATAGFKNLELNPESEILRLIAFSSPTVTASQATVTSYNAYSEGSFYCPEHFENEEDRQISANPGDVFILNKGKDKFKVISRDKNGKFKEVPLIVELNLRKDEQK